MQAVTIVDTEVLLSAKNIDLDKITICQFNEDGQNIIDSYVEITRHLQELGQLFQVFRFNLENLLNCYTIYPDDHLERAEHSEALIPILLQLTH